MPAYEKQNFENIDNNKINLLFVGRFDFAKGLDILLKVFESLGDNNYVLHIAGCSVNGDLSVEIENCKNIKCYGWLSPGELSSII